MAAIGRASAPAFDGLWPVHNSSTWQSPSRSPRNRATLDVRTTKPAALARPRQSKEEADVTEEPDRRSRAGGRLAAAPPRQGRGRQAISQLGRTLDSRQPGRRLGSEFPAGTRAEAAADAGVPENLGSQSRQAGARRGIRYQVDLRAGRHAAADDAL